MTRRTFTLAAMAATAGLAFPVHAGADDARLVMHEWGTFTTFSGADGVPRSFTTVPARELPDFVYTRARQAGDEEGHGLLTLGKGGYESRVRMETPVIYFYAKAPATVDVRVDMPQGLMTEFYPPVTEMHPPAQNEFAIRVGEITSTLVWKGVRVLPESSSRPPEITGPSHYAAARETDSSMLAFEHRGRVLHEKFLFYRGIGESIPAFDVRALGKGVLAVSTRHEDGVRVFALEVGADASIRFADAGPVRGRAEIALPAEHTSADTLAAALASALTDAGLYEKEAAAMVHTWRATWFEEPGTRVLYILPGPWVDAMLPLSISPPPGESRRVFVGRADILTPEAQGSLAAELLALSEVPAPGRDQARADAWSGFARKYGRFAGAAVHAVIERERPERAAQIRAALGW